MASLIPLRPQISVLGFGWNSISSPSSLILNLITPTRPRAPISNTALGRPLVLLLRQVLKPQRFMLILPYSTGHPDCLPLEAFNRSFLFHALSMNRPTQLLARHSCTMAPETTHAWPSVPEIRLPLMLVERFTL